MYRRGHILKLTAVSALVVLALTGFSSKGRGHGGSDGSSSGGGGGCSSSSQNHDSSSTSGGTSGSTYHDYDDDDDYSSGTSGTSSGSGSSATTSAPARDATVELVVCADVRTPYATVTVTNPNATPEFFTVTVEFLDARNRRVEQRTERAFVGGNKMERVEVDLSSPDLAAKIYHCRAEPKAPAA